MQSYLTAIPEAGISCRYKGNSTRAAAHHQTIVEIPLSKSREFTVDCFLLSFAPVVLTAMLLTEMACSSSRISWTYISHGANYEEMLQLTQTNNGQLTRLSVSSEPAFSRSLEPICNA